jgi:hypothetical protein
MFMKSALFAAALLFGTGAVAQQTVAPANDAPERDARGIPVISDPATAPAGTNEAVTIQPGATVVANPNAQAAFTTRPADQEYPACSRTVTDNCVQTYERGSRRPN